jgi:tRNA dimethylallyltransferase
MKADQELLCIAGPTASGKGALALELARRTGALVIVCDSMKVYRGIDVATAKPDAEARAGLDLRVIDVCDPWDRYDASRFVADALAALDEARTAGRPALLCGGTALYLKALTEGLIEGPGADPELRARLEAFAAERGVSALHARLRDADEAAAARIHPNDLRRIVRALEVRELTGRPISAQQDHFGGARPGIARTLVVLGRERTDMDRRIDARVRRMFEAGIVEECERLRALPRPLGREARRALGTREVLDWIEAGREEPERAVLERVQTHTRRFARRQLTWLRGHFADARWIEVGEGTTTGELAARVQSAHGGLLAR